MTSHKNSGKKLDIIQIHKKKIKPDAAVKLPKRPDFGRPPKHSPPLFYKTNVDILKIDLNSRDNACSGFLISVGAQGPTKTGKNNSQVQEMKDVEMGRRDAHHADA